jgi:hypothetical protein
MTSKSEFCKFLDRKLTTVINSQKGKQYGFCGICGWQVATNISFLLAS